MQQREGLHMDLHRPAFPVHDPHPGTGPGAGVAGQPRAGPLEQRVPLIDVILSDDAERSQVLRCPLALGAQKDK